MNKSKKDLLVAQERAKRAKDFKITPDGETYGDILSAQEMADLKKMKANLGDDLNKDYGSVNRMSYQTNQYGGPGGVEEYEIQYDPNNDF